MSSQVQSQKRGRRGQAVGTSSVPAVSSSTWPRPIGAPFPLPPAIQPEAISREKSQRLDGFLHRATSAEWLTYHSVFYNGLLNVTFEPTRVICGTTLGRLGISEQVTLLLHQMGLGTITYESYDLYTDLARQFLATCEVIYDDSCIDPSAGRLTFLCHGRRYSLTLDELAGVFGFPTAERARGFDTSALGRMTSFWNAIAYGRLTQSEMKITRIRNPVLRIVAKAIGHTFFCKKEPGSVRQDELMMLFLGLGDEVIAAAEFRGHLGELQRAHMGAYFAEVLAGRKYKGLGVTKEERVEPVGSLITPILKYCRVELPEEYKTDKGRLFIDETYLANAKICRNKVYQWATPGGVRFCKLPKSAWTALGTWEQIGFELPEHEQCRSDGEPLVPPPDPEQEYYTAPPPHYTDGPSTSAAPGQYCEHGNPYPQQEPIVEDFPEEYYAQMEPLPAGASFEDWRAHSDMVQQRQTGIMRRILRGLSKIMWTPRAACCSAPEDVHQPTHSPVPSVPAEMSEQEGSGDSSHRSGDGSGGSSSSAGRVRRRARHE